MNEKLRKIILFIPGVVMLGFFIAYGLQDFWVNGVVKDPVVIAQYHFGSEAMIGNGGDKFRSPEAYAMSSLVVALISIVSLTLSVLFLLKAKSYILLKSYSAVVISVLLIFVVDRSW